MKLEHEVTVPNPDRPPATVKDQAPVALVGLLAIAVIVAINYLARPRTEAADARLLAAPGCRECGTVIAMRRSAHSVPVTFLDIQMRDGPTRTVRGGGSGFSVGDVVEVRGEALTLRDVF